MGYCAARIPLDVERAKARVDWNVVPCAAHCTDAAWDAVPHCTPLITTSICLQTYGVLTLQMAGSWMNTRCLGLQDSPAMACVVCFGVVWAAPVFEL